MTTTHPAHTTGRCIKCETTVWTSPTSRDHGFILGDGTYLHDGCAEGAEVTVTATDLTLAPAGTLTRIVEVAGRNITIGVGTSAVLVAASDLKVA